MTSDFATLFAVPDSKSNSVNRKNLSVLASLAQVIDEISI